MSQKPVIQTERLVLRQWREEDLSSFARLNADPLVMEYFPTVKTFEESTKEYEAILEHFKNHGYGWWALAEINSDAFIGFVGLRHLHFKASFTPAVEVAWRLAYAHWGKGYATEAAKACLKYGFKHLKLSEIISFTSALNYRSENVMKRIGMQCDPAHDFLHPTLPQEHRLSKHIFYKIRANDWNLQVEKGL